MSDAPQIPARGPTRKMVAIVLRALYGDVIRVHIDEKALVGAKRDEIAQALSVAQDDYQQTDDKGERDMLAVAIHAYGEQLDPRRCVVKRRLFRNGNALDVVMGGGDNWEEALREAVFGPHGGAV